MLPLIVLFLVQAPRYATRVDHDPDGIGKFYMGREIARVQGHEAADWLDRPTREKEEAPTRLIAALGLAPGMTVVDIGAGSGTLSFPMAKRLTPGGKVVAEEIQPELIALIAERAKKVGVTNVEPLLGTTSDPKVPVGSADLMIMVDVYHEFDQPYEMVRSMVRGLKKGGHLVFVEYRKEDPRVPIKEVHKMTVAQVRKEMKPFPLAYRGTSEILPVQHIITFVKS